MAVPHVDITNLVLRERVAHFNGGRLKGFRQSFKRTSEKPGRSSIKVTSLSGWSFGLLIVLRHVALSEDKNSRIPVHVHQITLLVV